MRRMFRCPPRCGLFSAGTRCVVAIHALVLSLLALPASATLPRLPLPPPAPAYSQSLAIPEQANSGAAPERPLPPPPAPTPTAPMPLTAPTPAGPDSVPATALAPHDFAKLDRDRDGGLDRAECAADPILAQGFDGFDDNGDGRLSREEFASYQPGPGDPGGD